MSTKIRRKPKRKPTLADLTKRVIRLERRLAEVARLADATDIRTMRIGGKC